MRDLKKYGAECIDELKEMGFNVDGLKNIEWRVSRAKGRFGQCKYKYGKPTEINISSFMLDENVLKDDHWLKDTIIHELLHALTPGEGHKGRWKTLATKVNKHGKYNISRCGSFEEMGIDRSEISPPKKAAWVIECKKCGIKTIRIRKSKAVSHPELYRCVRCHGSLKSYAC